MKKIILMAETGSDINAQLAEEYGIEIVPMHISFDNETFDDGSFPVQKIVDYYKATGRVPTTSGSTPDDFIKAFDAVHAQYPEAHIIYLAYSAITTCSYQSAVIAAKGRDYVTAIDTKQVSAGQGAVVVAMAKALRENPEISVQEAAEKAEELISRACMCFLPDNLDFLRAGGRVSNVASLASRILGIHPCIEILEGKLVATKKYRGKMIKVVDQLITEFSDSYKMERDCLWLVYTIGLSDEVKNSAAAAAARCGFSSIQWIQANGVITTHGGPAAIGIAGFSEK